MHFAALLLLTLGELLAYLVFCKGFFPTKVLLTPEELSQFETPPPKSYQDPPKQFDRVVVMLVDAMRADFVFSDKSNMPFTQQLLNDGAALGFTAFSHPPTVTLPRLKGITTGSVPNFIDAVLNIAEDDTSSTLGDQDSWVKQMYESHWAINMFGDDTWLKLFPEYFTKTDGTSSFYVSDYTIVDRNVSRHLDEELSPQGQKAWDTMILHYLGLDHIGHKGGAESANMPPKQRELDGVVKKIYDKLLKNDPKTLMVLLGDHGMNDVGNHGGSSVGEVSAAMVLISSQFEKSKLASAADQPHVPQPYDPEFKYMSSIDQIDLVPTLTELCGLDVPINNLGAFIPELLGLYSANNRRNALIKNALQLKVLLDKSRSQHGTPLEAVCDVTSEDSLIEYIRSAKKELSEASSDYNYPDLYRGMAAYATVTFFALVWFVFHYKNHPVLGLVDVAFFVLYAASFFGSSTIEEEHHIWWFFTIILVAYTIQLSFREGSWSFFFATLLLVSLRLLKAWNNSGQKYNSNEYLKIGSWLQQLNPESCCNTYAALLCLTFLPFVIAKASQQVGRQDALTFVDFVAVSMMTSILMSVKMVSFLTSVFDLDTDMSSLPKWCTLFIDWLQAYSGIEDYNDISNELYHLFQLIWVATTAFSLLKPTVFKLLGAEEGDPEYTLNILILASYLGISQTNFSNVPLFATLFFIQLAFRAILPASITRFRLSNYLSLFTIILQNLSFFQFGETNSLASVDLTNSFNGLSSYNMVLSGILTFVANWAGPMFWTVSYVKMGLDAIPEARRPSTKWNILYDRMLFNLAFYSIGGLCLIYSCYNLRFHLFIWTVFSPKLLYFLAWLTSNLLLDTLLSALLVACAA